LSPLLAAGFYYKTFMWPARFWKRLYEPLIRRGAGLGRASLQPDPDLYEKAYAHCDVLIIGSGPAGLMAALAAARGGARVILAEEDFRFGGRLLAERFSIDGMPAAEWVERARAELASFDSVRLMPRTTVYGVYDQGTYGAVERVNDHLAVPQEFQPRQRSWHIVAKRVVLASGAIERTMAFASGELAYEIAVPARYGDALMRALIEAGEEYGIVPYGTEALNVLRIEKGHVAGPEFNGQTTARDLGLGGMMARDKDYIGRVMAERPALQGVERPILVGVMPLRPSRILSAGSHFLGQGSGYVAANDEGHLTSVAWSPELGHDIGLGFLKRGTDRLGERIRAVDLLRGQDVECVVCAPVFVDPKGERARA
jgi:glycine cleavage system aminomethyltransferase T